MTKSVINRARERVDKELRKSVIARKDAVARCDTKSEMALSGKIEDYNTILWALKVAQMADKKVQEYIFECPRCGYAQRFHNPSIEHHCPFHPEVKMRLIRVAETE